VVSAPNDRPPASPFGGDSEMAERMRTFHWTATPLGPIESWPTSLRTAVGICLRSRFPMLLWWGSELVMLYNDAYRPILGGSKHPAALGAPGETMWQEIWPVIGPMLQSVRDAGKATWSEDQLLVFDRNGYAEECYFTFSYSPIIDETGAVGGVFTAVTETTGRVIGERRMATLRRLGELSAVATASDAQACRAVLDVLAGDPADVPFSLIYLLAEDGASARLVGSYGIATGGAGAAIAPPVVPQTGGEALVWQVASTGRATVVTGLSQRYPGALPAGVAGVGSAQPDTAVVLPLGAAGLDRWTGVLVAGVSPFRALDSEYRGFCELVAGHVAGAVAMRARMSRSVAGPRRWPNWTGPRRSSSPASATNSAPR
jgi:hypothetical protein